MSVQNPEKQNEITPNSPNLPKSETTREGSGTAPPPDNSPDNDGAKNTKAAPPDDAQGKKRFRTVLIGLGIAFAVLLAFGIVPRLRARPKLRQDAQRQSTPPSVSVTYPQEGPAITTLTLPGDIQAIQSTDISARTSGYVSRWFVDIGDRVKPGQVLAEIAAPEVDQEAQQARAQVVQSEAGVLQQQAEVARAQATLQQSRENARKSRAQLAQARADLGLAKITWERWQALVKEGAVSEQAADEKRAAYNNNNANVNSLEAAVAASASDITAYASGVTSAQANVRAAQAQVAASRANLLRYAALRGFQRIRAPFAGVITARSIDAGALIGGGAAAGGGGSGAPVSSGGGGAAGASSSASSNTAAGGGGSRTAMYNSASDSNLASATATIGSDSGGSASAGGGSPTGTTQGNAGSSVLPSSGSTSAAAQNAAGRGGAPNPTSGGGGSAAGGTATAPTSGGDAGSSSGGSTDNGVGGAVVSPGMSLFILARLDVLRIQVSVPQTFSPTVRPGQKARVTLAEYPNRTFTGVVTRTANALDPATRTMLAEVQLSNRDRRILPGMFAQVVFDVVRTSQPLLIPSGALIYDAHGTRIATVGADNKIHLVPVQVGRDYGPTVEITSGDAGIDAHTRVVTNPSQQTRDGAPARAVLDSSGDNSPQKADGSSGQKSGGGGSSPPPPNTGARYGGANAAADTAPKSKG